MRRWEEGSVKAWASYTLLSWLKSAFSISIFKWYLINQYNKNRAFLALNPIKDRHCSIKQTSWHFPAPASTSACFWHTNRSIFRLRRWIFLSQKTSGSSLSQVTRLKQVSLRTLYPLLLAEDHPVLASVIASKQSNNVSWYTISELALRSNRQSIFPFLYLLFSVYRGTTYGSLQTSEWLWYWKS